MLFVATALAAFAVTAPAALANPTVSVDANNALSIQGGSENSVLTVSFLGGYYEVTRSGGNLVAGGSPCLLVLSNKVSCAMGGNTPSSIQAALAGGTDTITFNSTLPTDATAVVTGVGSVTSQSVPLDAQLDETRSGISANGGPMPDNINVQVPTACTANVNGGAGDDQIRINVDGAAAGSSCSFPTNSITNGGSGDDLLNVEESAVNFTYQSSEGHDVFLGGSGNDHITVGDGPDWAFGGPGHDRFYDNGGPDPSKLWGGAGNDTYTDWDSDESDISFFDGGSGQDQVAYHNLADTYNVTLSLDGVANDGVGAEMDNIHKSVEFIGTDNTYNSSGQFRGNDVLIGSNGPNVINGRNGDDEIHGGSGDDILYGEAGNDMFYCGDGHDKVYTGGDSDNWDEDCEEVTDFE